MTHTGLVFDHLNLAGFTILRKRQEKLKTYKAPGPLG
jgi:hypothetical protein